MLSFFDHIGTESSFKQEPEPNHLNTLTHNPPHTPEETKTNNKQTDKKTQLIAMFTPE